MTFALLAILGGFALLVWSADRFVEGAAATARHVGMPSLLIGMVIVGFGTSAPEMVVSAMAALDGNPDLALGNAIGSNIVNTGLILGITALVAPIAVHSKIVRKELPLLLIIGLVSGMLFWNGALSRGEGLVLLAGFFGLIGWSVYSALKGRGDALEAETEQELSDHAMTLGRAIFWLVVGLVLLIISSRILVWGAVTIAQALGVSDLIIGLTIVALGTSLPELAASVIAARKGEHDIAIGNVVGSNMFNLLAVVGIAGVIAPMPHITSEVMTRDWPVMMAMTVGLFVMAYGFRGEGRINRIEGSLLLMAFAAYNTWLVISVVGGQAG
ncbi:MULTISPECIES: calcium/sodium antiporter [Marinobacter]|uniref:calcium/sodium antiporter n=1 Tax=Marinobacter TaxID=2742 RepID=UPI000C8B6ABD|nr:MULTISPECIES: calcium/sodium antiporter [unclassified Marinobacter]MAC21353.1 calcium/sodium antiporter [Marinobacter sp.]HCL38313.1 calcium/sodium antiporter [Marinobacter nauticus]|tara:strand:+ start:17698 stop:18681 length:984 start_codon:yes stop_codon:yes gene_type:complete